MARNVSDVIDNARFNGYHLRIIMICGLLILFDGFDLTAISYAAPDLIKHLGINRSLIGPVFSAGLFGLTLGALGFGLIGDRLGIKPTFALCCVVFGVFTLATVVASSLTELMVYRFIAGLGLGGASPLSVAYASDYCPKKVRTSVVMIMYINLSVGQIVAGYTYSTLAAFGWQAVFIVGGILPLLLVPVMLLLMPDGLEHMVLRKAAPEKINAVLAKIEPSVPAVDTEFTIAKENKQGFQLAELFRDGRAAVTAVLWCVFFTSLIAMYFFMNWIPTLLQGSGLDKTQIVIITSALPFGGILGTLVASTVVMKVSGFRTVAIGYFCAAIAMALLSMAGSEFLLLAVGTLAVGMFLIGTQSVLNAVAAAVYPPTMRATGIGWGFGIGRIGSIISPSIAGLLVALHWQPADLFRIAALPTLAACIAAYVVARLLASRAPARHEAAPVLARH
ncbi:MFS transporter [Xanthobacteraceae bacterium Astr-EGSB]|uniref:MFS transporter n=1 Tax=Astrobacterium formosum TaxID=3069710 RepID=UPI0027B6D68E|nr:MFS transporter [Xanthobacteraceae bacterium Astr-EGSB]